MAQSDIENDPDLADVRAVLKRLQKLAPPTEAAAEAAPVVDQPRPVVSAPPPPVGLSQLSTLRQAGGPPRLPPTEPPIITQSPPLPAPAPASRTLRHGAIAAGAIALIAVGTSLLLSTAGTPLSRGWTAPIEAESTRRPTGASRVPERAGESAADRSTPASAALPSPALAASAEAASEATIETILSRSPGPSDGDQSTAGNALVEAAVRTAGQALSAGRVTAARATLLQIADNESADIAWMLARSFDPNVLATLPSPDAGPDPIEAEFWYRVWHARAVFHGLVPDSVSIDRLIRALR